MNLNEMLIANLTNSLNGPPLAYLVNFVSKVSNKLEMNANAFKKQVPIQLLESLQIMELPTVLAKRGKRNPTPPSLACPWLLYAMEIREFSGRIS